MSTFHVVIETTSKYELNITDLQLASLLTANPGNKVDILRRLTNEDGADKSPHPRPAKSMSVRVIEARVA